MAIFVLSKTLGSSQLLEPLLPPLLNSLFLGLVCNAVHAFWVFQSILLTGFRAEMRHDKTG